MAYQAVKTRQFRAYTFPTGIDAGEMPEFWSNLNFGGTPETQATYKMEHFREPSAIIRRLRKASKADKVESDLIAMREAGKPKIVYGQEEPWVGPVMERGDNGTEKGTSGEITNTEIQIPNCSEYDFSDEVSPEEMGQE